MLPLAVLVAPSTDKAWIRAPWDAELKEIPDDLVKTVARPCAKEDTTRSGGVAPRQAVPTDDGPHGGGVRGARDPRDRVSHKSYVIA